MGVSRFQPKASSRKRVNPLLRINSRVVFHEVQRHLQAHEHPSPALIKHIEFCHDLAEIIAGNLTAVFPAPGEQPAGIVLFFGKVIRVDACIHPAVCDPDIIPHAALIPVDEHEDQIRAELPFQKQILLNGSSDAVSMNLRKPCSTSSFLRSAAFCSKHVKPSV